jgi:hypothetical protein
MNMNRLVIIVGISIIVIATCLAQTSKESEYIEQRIDLFSKRLSFFPPAVKDSVDSNILSKQLTGFLDTLQDMRRDGKLRNDEQYYLWMFFPLENRTLFRLKIAHLFATITHKLPLGNHSLQSIQEEQKGDSNGRLGNNQDSQSKESCNELARDLTFGADQSAYRQERTGEQGTSFIPEGVINDRKT